uniref:Zinc finger CCCH domain-containing protein 14 n=1 Tax=Lygus hesperus TaxID=30085 RepID=A0A0A9XBR5_LYGHE
MGKLGEEVSQKIKSAIKAKLMELGIHIDNELPDYVMVLVANKKTQQQMEDDLSLFLGESTKTFTSWLHNVLKKLEQVTISTKAKKKEKLRKRGIDDSNGVSSTKKVKAERSEELFKTEPLDYPPEPGPSPKNAVPADEDSENDDAMSLTDHTEVRNDIVNEPESTSLDVCPQKDDDTNDKLSSNEAKPRERIKIVWDKEGETLGDQSSRNRSKDIAKKTTERVREREKERKTRSRSRSRSRYSNKKKMRSDEDDERDRPRNKSKDPVRAKRTSSSPKRKSSGERKVVDARDILKRKGADKKITSSKSRKRDSRSPHRRGARSMSREPVREKQMNSVLKAVIRAPEKPPPTIQSLVKVTPRPVRPPSMQPNCNLILKAVADAEKSLATSNASSRKKEAYEDKKSKKGRNKRYDYAVKGNISVTLLNDRVVASKLGVPLDAYPKEDKEVGEGEATKFENEASQEANTEEDTMSMAIEEDDYIDSFEREDQYTMDPPPAPPEEYQPMMHSNETPQEKALHNIAGQHRLRQ